MKLTLTIDVAHARATLKELRGFVAGSVYSPFTLEFPESVTVRHDVGVMVKLRSGPGESVVASAADFTPDSENPCLFHGTLDLTGPALQEWLKKDEGSRSHTGWLEVSQKDAIYVSCETVVIPSGRLGSTETGAGGYLTEEEVKEIVQSAVSSLKDELAKASFSKILKGYTETRGGVPGFVVVQGESSEWISTYEPSTLYVDTESNTMFIANSDLTNLVPLTPELTNVKDVILSPATGSSTAISELANKSDGVPEIEYVDTAYVVGYLGDTGKAFFDSDDNPMAKVSGILYVDGGTGKLYRWDNQTKSFTEIASPEASGSSAITNIEIGVTPSGSAPTVEVQNGTARISGVLGCAVIRGSLDKSGMQFQPEGSSTYVKGDPRVLYIETTETATNLYTVDGESGEFKKLPQADDLDTTKCVKTVTLNGVELQAVDGNVDLGNVIVSAVVLGTFLSADAFLVGNTQAALTPGVLYIDKGTSNAYVYSETGKKLESALVAGDGEPNKVESIVVNGKTYDPDGSKTIDLGNLLTTAVVVGDLATTSTGAQGGFVPAGDQAQIITKGTPGVLYVSGTQNMAYVWDDAEQNFKALIYPTGQDNVIESVVMNGVSLPVTGKSVDIGSVISSAFVTGSKNDSGIFVPDEDGTTAPGTASKRLYLDRDTRKLYWYNGYGFQEIGNIALAKAVVNNTDITAEDGVLNIGKVVRRVEVNGQTCDAYADGVVDLTVPSVREATAQRVHAADYSASDGTVNVKFTDAVVNKGSVIFRCSVRKNAALTLDVEKLVDALEGSTGEFSMAFTFEVWVRNTTSDSINIGIPAKATTGPSKSRDITWLSATGESVTVPGGHALYATFRVAPDFDTVSDPRIHASVYHVG